MTDDRTGAQWFSDKAAQDTETLRRRVAEMRAAWADEQAEVLERGATTGVEVQEAWELRQYAAELRGRSVDDVEREDQERRWRAAGVQW